MKKLLMVLLMAVFLSPVMAFSADKDALTMKRDLLQERVARIQAELGLLKIQYGQEQEALRLTGRELQGIEAQLKAMEPKKEEKKK